MGKKRLIWLAGLLMVLVLLLPMGTNHALQENAQPITSFTPTVDPVLSIDPIQDAQASSDPLAVTRRGLFVSCDFFITQVDTWPSSNNNIKTVADTLSGGSMSFDKMVFMPGNLYSVAGLEHEIQSAFGDADENDVSYFYISTHGTYDAAQPNLDAGLYLSNGVSEEIMTARQLQDAFAGIKGTKVLIIDACNSGAFIGKGLSGGAGEAAFLGPDYKVLTSAGGSEESWYWSSAGKETQGVQGASYFASALSDALGYHGEYGADLNGDGEITLSDSYRYLLENHSASMTQSYPQEDDFVLFTYDVNSLYKNPSPEESIITGVTFYDTVLDNMQNTVSFEFTVEKPVQVAYQIVYYKDGKWQFSAAPLKYDDKEIVGDFGDQKGFLSPGRKQRTLELAPQGNDTYGYAMIQLVTLEENKTTVHASRVLCVPPASGDPELSVKTDAALDLKNSRELSILINHKYPCLLSVSIIDANGKTVRRLSSYQPTRPQHLTPTGSFFYWGGKLADGSLAAPGEYTVKVTAYIGDVPYEAVSASFALLGVE